MLWKLHRMYAQSGIPTHWAEPTEQSPFHSAIVRFDEIGERNASMTMGLSFIPGMEPFEREGVYLLQSFVNVCERADPMCTGQLLETWKMQCGALTGRTRSFWRCFNLLDFLASM